MISNKVKVNFDPEIFTDVYWKICDVKTRFRIIYGGTGSSKSFSLAQDEIIKGLEKKETVLVIRKVASTLKDSIYKSFKKRLVEFNLTAFSRYTVSPLYITLANGTEYIFAGLDDPEKLKSIEGITRIVVEEGSELTYEDFKELNRRLRGVENPQMTILFNPIDEDHWLKTHFFDTPVHNATCIHSTHWDNKFLTQDDHDEIEAIKLYDENQYNIYALGKWGKLKTGSEFFPAFSQVRHTGPVKFLPHLPIHTSWDFNVLPYQPMAAFQIAENVKRWQHPKTKQRLTVETAGYDMIYVTQVRAFAEYAFKPPINDTDNVCQSYLDDYGDYDPDTFLYGDASGKHKEPGTGDGSNFKRIKTKLAKVLNTGSDRVLKSNPSVMKSRDFMNKMFANFYPIEFIADPEKCPTLIKDLSSVQLTRGGMLKEIVHDPKNKNVTWQKAGHFSDLTRYLMVSVFYDIYKSNE